MHINEEGDIVIKINEIAEAFSGGRCKIDSNHSVGDFNEDDRFSDSFWSSYYINEEKLKELGLNTHHEANICVNLLAEGDITDPSDIECPNVSFDSDSDNWSVEHKGVVFVNDDGSELEFAELSDAIVEQLDPRDASNFDEEFDKFFDRSFYYGDPIWVAKYSEFEDGFNRWLYTDEDQKTVIQIVLDRCKETGQDLTPGDFTDGGLEFETDDYETTTVADYIIDNEIHALSGWAEEYIEKQEALEAAKNKKSSGRSR